MTIVCGTDFTESALRAVAAAADLAVAMNVQLHLVHALTDAGDPLLDPARAEHESRAKQQLEQVAHSAQQRGARVATHVVEGPPDETLEAFAKHVGAQLIIVAALGRRREGRWQVGTHAERLAHHAHVPVLVVRNADLFHGWVKKQRALRVLLGIDASTSSDSALQWFAQLQKFGPCQVVATHLYWPPTEFDRLGLRGVRSLLEPDAEVTKSLTQSFERRVRNSLGETPVELRLEPHLGNVGDRLALLAEEEHADLIVVGSHDRALPGRIMYGSVSREVVQQSRVSVACIPLKPSSASYTGKLASALIATDFSALGNSAIPLAYSVVADGGIVHLVHVLKDDCAHNQVAPADIFPSQDLSPAEVEARKVLLKLIPKDVAGAVRTRVHVLHSNDTAHAICQAAERLDTPVICIGSRGGGLARALLGSVAARVLTDSARAVLLARTPRE